MGLLVGRLEVLDDFSFQLRNKIMFKCISVVLEVALAMRLLKEGQELQSRCRLKADAWQKDRPMYAVDK